MRTQRHLLAVLSAVSLLGSGCSLIPLLKGEAGSIRVRASAAARLNPDERGESLPTAVRVYQLKSAAKVQAVELADLLQDPKTALGEAFLGMDEVVVTPGGKAEKDIPREKDAEAVIVVGLFRRPAGTTWREIVDLGWGSLRLNVWLEDYRLVRR